MNAAGPSQDARSGLVTLLTDFGLRDPYVGIVKGMLHRHAPALRAVIDLTHDVPAQDVRAAAFLLEHAWRWFPAGTVHVAVVDPGVGTARGVLVVRAAEHLFVAPDNGLLGPLLAATASAEVRVHVPSEPPLSRTFHGRDVFAPLAGALAAGLPFEQAGPLGRPAVKLELPRVRIEADERIGEVLYVDVFGNLVTNLTAADVGQRCLVEFMGRPVPRVATYAEAQSGAAVALIDSFGVLEIAVQGGHAAQVLGAGVGAAVRVRSDRKELAG